MTTPTNTGGPAFPEIVTEWPGSNYHNTHSVGGMTLRDYFAAHAPEMPEWFKIPPTRPMPPMEFMPDDFDSDFEVKQAKQHRQEWRDEQAAAALFAWRWHYADMMVRGREAS